MLNLPAYSAGSALLHNTYNIYMYIPIYTYSAYNAYIIYSRVEVPCICMYVCSVQYLADESSWSYTAALQLVTYISCYYYYYSTVRLEY